MAGRPPTRLPTYSDKALFWCGFFVKKFLKKAFTAP
jgi:hypothetical protein